MSLVYKNKSFQHGFSMIELLVAVLVLAVGLLGLASLQTRSLQFNYSAYQRTQANILAYDIIDRMRANPAVVATSGYNFEMGTGPVGTADCQSTLAECTSGDMANFDLTQWVCSLGKWNSTNTCQDLSIEGPLADGDGAVTITANGGRSMVTVTISWVDDRTLEEDNPNRMETFTVSSVL